MSAKLAGIESENEVTENKEDITNEEKRIDDNEKSNEDEDSSLSEYESEENLEKKRKLRKERIKQIDFNKLFALDTEDPLKIFTKIERIVDFVDGEISSNEVEKYGISGISTPSNDETIT